MNVPNPLSDGNPITDQGRFFGRRREVELIFSRLQNPEFESSSNIGERRLGKTSLLYHVSHPKVIQRFHLDPGVYLFIYLDLGIVGPDSTPHGCTSTCFVASLHVSKTPDSRRRSQGLLSRIRQIAITLPMHLRP